MAGQRDKERQEEGWGYRKKVRHSEPESRIVREREREREQDAGIESKREQQRE